MEAVFPLKVERLPIKMDGRSVPYKKPPVAAALPMAVTLPRKSCPVCMLLRVAMPPPSLMAVLFVKVPEGKAQQATEASGNNQRMDIKQFRWHATHDIVTSSLLQHDLVYAWACLIG